MMALALGSKKMTLKEIIEEEERQSLTAASLPDTQIWNEGRYDNLENDEEEKWCESDCNRKLKDVKLHVYRNTLTNSKGRSPSAIGTLIDMQCDNMFEEQQTRLNNKLFVACEKGRVKEVCLLVKQGADVNAKKNVHRQHHPLGRSHTLLHIAASCGLEGGNSGYFSESNAVCIIDLLIRHGANINSRDVSMFTPLMLGCKYGNYFVCKALLERGRGDKKKRINIHAKLADGRDALMIAAREAKYSSSFDICKLLISNGATLNR